MFQQGPIELDGKSLGEKHQHYNKLVNEAIKSNASLDPGDLNSGEYDIAHLMKIDIASRNRDVEYILKVLKCEDMLYVSRAIKQSTWLITEQQYSHIVNVDYLNTHLFPEMTVNAKTKFIKHIKHNLKDEKRAEEFFNYEIETSIKNAVKWLPNCSENFIIQRVQKYLSKSKNVRLFKRLCEKSPKVLAEISKSEFFEAANFLLHVDSTHYLKIIEEANDYHFPTFGKRTTKLLMQKHPDRIINNFQKYCNKIHLATFVQYIKLKNIKEFLFTQSKIKNDRLDDFFSKPKNVRCFINAMPVQDRTKFLDQVFVNKVHCDDDAYNEDSENYAMRKFYNIVTSRMEEHSYYFGFNVAFDKITKAIRVEKSQPNKDTLLKILIQNADNDLHALLKYYQEKHINDPMKSKEKFVRNLLPKIHVSKLDPQCWNIIEDLMKQLMENYNESEDKDQNRYLYPPENIMLGCLETIILYNIINDNPIAAEIKNKYYLFKKKENLQLEEGDRMAKKINMRGLKTGVTGKSFLHNHRRFILLSDLEKQKVFDYFYGDITKVICNQKISNESDFKEGLYHLKYILHLIVVWKKDLSSFPWILDKIKEYLKIKKDQSFKTSMTFIYNKKKSWKRLMFEDSIQLCPFAVVCFNALKHDQELLSLERDEVNNLLIEDRVQLDRLLKALRVYWPRSLALEWTQRFQDWLPQPYASKGKFRGLCILLPRQQLLDILTNYAPKQAKIKLEDIDETTLNVQKQLAKYMHLARPRPPPEITMMYAKGDYLKHALPSLLAMFNNANANQTRNFITQLLFAPVSVQKHGIRLAYEKLTPEEVLPVFNEIWIKTSNSTIRAELFKFTYSFLNKTDNDNTTRNDIWKTLFIFIDNLSFKEDKTIYSLISEKTTLEKVPDELKSDYFSKIHKYLTDLIPKLTEPDNPGHYEWRLQQLIGCLPEYMELMSTDFMVDILSKFIELVFLKKFATKRYPSHKEKTCNETRVLSAFLLCTKADKTQMERYNKFFLPFLERCVSLWDSKEGNEYFIRSNVDELLECIRFDLKKYVWQKKMDVPLTIFEDIQRLLNQLVYSENYIFLTKWKLTVELARLLQKTQFKHDWDETCTNIAPDFGKTCLEYLKSDVASNFYCIYLLFSEALFEVMKVMPDVAKFEIYQNLLGDVQIVHAHLAVIKLYPENSNETFKKDLRLMEMLSNIRMLLGEHPSVEVKMHYNHKFSQSLSSDI